jgi:hypothetical protein
MKLGRCTSWTAVRRGPLYAGTAGIEVDTSLPGARVVRVLEDLSVLRGLPQTILMDNGPELTSRVLDQ